MRQQGRGWDSHDQRVEVVQMYRCIEVQKYTDTVVQGYKGRQIKRYRGREVQKFKSTEVERYKVHRCPAGVGTKPTQGCASFPSRASALHSDPSSSKLSIILQVPPSWASIILQTSRLNYYNFTTEETQPASGFFKERNRKRTKSLY